jgi:predicted GIY-YIG superfamily endonuclease
MFWTYMLRCSDGHYYVGQTDDIDRRIAEHQSGAFKGYSWKRRPVTLVWSESFQTRDQAKSAEAKIKGWSRAKKEALIASDWNLVSKLAQSRQTEIKKKP